ncbi:amidohydrolase [Aestuariimicrobium ganziense]|uniref:amidohydrolase n=1 Tax=Aestuariimicrobium ganziense TaxID=2773677 RepID=UPI001941F38F|nr:amidohydrolase [Aestuariimicrobium ganziense]
MSHAIINAHVVPVVGDPFDGTVVFDEGRITALGADVTVPEGAEVFDAGGQWLLPGFVEAHGHVGIHEEGIAWAGNDTNEGTEVNGARFRALDAIHPSDEGFRDALSGGVTSMVVKPGSANPIGGQTVALKCWGRMVDEMVIKSPCSMKSALGENPKRFHGAEQKRLPSTRQGVAAVLRDAFTKARDYGAKRAEAAREGKPFDHDLTSEALLQVLDGTLPWCQHTHRVDDIATAIRIADEFGYRLVINHGTEAHLLADVLAERNLPVVIGPLMTSRSKWEVNQRSLANPGHLARAGVTIAITTDAPVIPINFLVYQVILAVKDGLDRTVGLESITINPARILGLDERVGSLEVGKDADLVLWSGDPLDIYSRAESVWVDGRRVYDYDHETNEGVTLDAYSTLGTTVAPPQRGRR